MTSNISQRDAEENEPSTRKWGEDFILYNPDNPGGSWISISKDKIVDLDDMR